MKRDENIYNYGHAVRQKYIIENSVVPDPLVSPEIQDRHDSADSFISLVYQLDPVSKLPTGDLNYLVSDKANPDVKKWILDNLMTDVSVAAVPGSLKGLSDDDLIALSRDPRESSDDYMNRVNDYARMNADLYGRLAKASVTGLDQQRSVPSEPEETSVSSE